MLRLPSDLAALDEVADYVRAIVDESRLDSARAYHLRLAVDEVVTNVIVHGYHSEPTGTVMLQAGLEPDRVWVRIEDTAPPFDPLSHLPEVDVTTPLSQREPGGLGLFLVRDVVDDFQYEFVDGRNRQTLVISRT